MNSAAADNEKITSRVPEALPRESDSSPLSAAVWGYAHSLALSGTLALTGAPTDEIKGKADDG
jgi:hypothetical protein